MQEAAAKLDELADLSGPGGLEWHFVGALQSNKTRTVAERFDWVHTVSRIRVAHRLSDQRPAWAPPLNVCLQVNVGGESSKSGVRIAEVADLAAGGGGSPPPAAPRTHDPARPCPGLDAQRAALRPLVEVYERLRADGLPLARCRWG